jgi:RNA polymerase sigma-70 factor (ECF subfamily)
VRDRERLCERLQPVREAIYLLFSEGYHGAHPRAPVGEELCHEARRLAGLLARLPGADGPETQALLAFLCLLAARLPARLGDDGSLRG